MGTPDTIHTRDNLFGDGGSTFSGSSGSHGSHGGSGSGGGGNRSPTNSLADSSLGAGSESSSSGFSGAWVGRVVGLAGGGLEGKIVMPASLSRVLLRRREARLLGGGLVEIQVWL
ncbi:hypothetical protein K435DRAFT_854984 [Dendrothele bispora CBS 962.96]|uniref:Uncharacterized protein n=1 Tax=Dendrothele bispora (strain CBS 962.96) TaxID=1314807 RepID=A0A4S8MDL8_DENBC|nr:hypothetical protein K435DRAFT_854984 [Dendrothele bispora CBS 962.96]